MDLDDMRCFVDVLESGGLNVAAKRLGISKSVVSRRISKVEAELGTRLLSRTTGGMSPTEAGIEFKARCERILAEFDTAREVVTRHGADVVGRLRLSAPQSFGVRHVTPVLAELAKRHPRLEIDVCFSDRSVDLINEGFDAAIRIGSLQDSSLVARRIAPVRSVLIASPAYLAQRGRPTIPADLTDHDCLLYSGRIGTDWKFRSGGRWVSVRPTGRLRADSGETIVEWAVAGLGIADAPTFLLSEYIDSGALEPLLLDYTTEDYGIFVLRPPGNHVPGKVRVLIESLVECFGREPHWDRCLMQMATQAASSSFDVGPKPAKLPRA